MKRKNLKNIVFTFILMCIFCLSVSVSAEMFSAGESQTVADVFGSGENIGIPDQPQELPGEAVVENVTDMPAENAVPEENSLEEAVLDEIVFEMEGTATLPGTESEPEKVTCTVSFYTGDGVMILDQKSVNVGTNYVLPDFTDAGYKNLGWALQANAAVADYAIGASYTIEQDVNFYLVRTKMVNAVFYSKNGKTNALYRGLGKTVEKGTTIILPALQETIGYEAKGWSLTKSSVTADYLAGQTVVLDSDTTFYAAYKYVGKSTVKFTNNSGTTTSKAYTSLTTVVTKKTSIVLPTVPKASGYINLGWTTVKKGTTAMYKAGDRVTISKSTKFYAVRKKSAKIYLCTKAGKLWKTIEVEKNSYYTLPGAKNKNGYTMMGWSKKKNQSKNPQYEVGEKIKITGNIKLYSVLYIRSKETDYTSLQLDGISKDLLSKYKRVVFVGDSRTVRTEKTLKMSGYSPAAYNISFIASTGQGLSWLKETGYQQLLSKVGNSTSKLGKPTAVIFNLGVNDLSNVSEYVQYMKSIAPELEKRGCKLYYMSVNPVNNVMVKTSDKKSRPEATIRSFNSKIKSQLCGKYGAYTYLNSYDYLMKYGYGTDAGKEGYDIGADDGLHYTTKTTKRIFRYCINSIK